MDLTGKRVLITGAAKRIGREISLTLARRGADIILHYSRSRREATRLEKEIRELGVQAWCVPCDFLARGEIGPRIRSFVSQVVRAAGQVDVLINNASIFYPVPLEKITEKEWNAFLSVNLKVPFLLSQAFGLKMMKAKKGCILNLLDSSVERPAARFLPYAISKSGLAAATRGLAKALAPHVRVMGIAPGPILPAEYATRSEQEQAAKRTLLGRYGSPKDIATTVKFILEEGDFMTGSILYVDGGASLT